MYILKQKSLFNKYSNWSKQFPVLHYMQLKSGLLSSQCWRISHFLWSWPLLELYKSIQSYPKNSFVPWKFHCLLYRNSSATFTYSRPYTCTDAPRYGTSWHMYRLHMGLKHHRSNRVNSLINLAMKGFHTYCLQNRWTNCFWPRNKGMACFFGGTVVITPSTI